jgi:Asp-tRNA(Asn)/Glu-tRNA(Gln) amidotransferase A subunit family amidase
MIKEIGAFAKAYTRSDDFKSKYDEYRTNHKPTAPEHPQSMADLKKQSIESIQESIKNMEDNLKSYTGDVRTSMEQAVATLKDQLKQYQDPDNPMFSKETENLMKQGYDAQVQEYQTQLEEWGQKYPETPDAMIRERLNYFLQVSSTIDFNAKLTKSEYGKMIFVNEDYENKPSEWKMIFRAGKESCDASRQVAQQWLSELK